MGRRAMSSSRRRASRLNGGSRLSMAARRGCIAGSESMASSSRSGPSRSDDQGDDDARLGGGSTRVMARYFEAASGCIERHGGTVEKFIGDAVMAVFGVPTAHEDDALRALRAAGELTNSLNDLNDQLRKDHSFSLELRVGVNTGEVVTGTEERLATGDAVN